MEFAISIPQVNSTPSRIERFLRRAEALPFTGAWCLDQVIGTAPALESVTTLAFAASVTKRLRLGIAVLIIAQRNPVNLAKSLSSLDVLSGGRLILGVGMGHGTQYYSAFGLTPKRGSQGFARTLKS
jgi:alkanesulfonate monooxygenase SsuD/methylene tetrahydromethanopterin reductase-like flavin-dependent oxidoreductase (luciferase family)